MDESTLDEISAIKAAKLGDLEAFNGLVLKYQDAVYNQAYWILSDPYRAEDLAQETFLQAYRRLSSFQDGSFRAWLLRIATNASLDELRRLKRHPLLPLESAGDDGEIRETLDWLPDRGPSVEETVEQSELAAEIQQAIRKLPQDYQTVLVLVDILEYDYAEAAAAMGVPVGTLKSRLARARLRLRDRLEKSPEFLRPSRFYGLSGVSQVHI